MHMISKKDLSDAEMNTLTKLCSPSMVLTPNEVETFDDAELDTFLTIKVLEDTPAVSSLGKLCDEHGYSYEWITGQKPHLIKNFLPITMQHGELRSDRGSWLVSEFFLQFSLFNINDTFKAGDWSSDVFLNLVYLTTHDIFNGVARQERGDLCEERTERPVSQANQNQIKTKTTI